MNIIVNNKGRARLTDYGLDPVYSVIPITMELGSSGVKEYRWLAPEIQAIPSTRVERVTESKDADVFAFGMVGLEILTGKEPFENSTNIGAMNLILKGNRPQKPENRPEVGLTDDMWNLLSRCWHKKPGKRPVVGDIVGELQGLCGGDGGSLEHVKSSKFRSHSKRVSVPGSHIRIPQSGVNGYVAECYSRVLTSCTPVFLVCDLTEIVTN
jgi:serine/threonine protein kinase